MKTLLNIALAVMLLALLPLSATASPVLSMINPAARNANMPLPWNYDLPIAAGPLTGAGVGSHTRLQAVVGRFYDPANPLVQVGRSRLTWTFHGFEQPANNEAWFAGVDFGTQYSAAGDTHTTVHSGGALRFAYCTMILAVGSCIQNDGLTYGPHAADLQMGVSSFFRDANGNSSAFLFFGDGRQRGDFDDMVVQVTASAVPLPAALPLLGAGLSGLAMLRLRRRHAARGAV